MYGSLYAVTAHTLMLITKTFSKVHVQFLIVVTVLKLCLSVSM